MYWKDDLIELGAEEVARQFYECYKEESPDELNHYKDGWFNWDNVYSNIRIRVMNYERNLEWLQEYPHEQFLDLAVVCYIQVGEGLTCNVHNEMLKIWGITEQQLMEQAKVNMKNISCQRKSVLSVLRELMFGEADEEFCWESDNEQLNMIQCNTPRFGAAVILQIENFSFLSQDSWILPSSVEEVLVMPCKDADKDKVKKIVRDINLAVVSKTEFLSDNIYLYNYEKQELTIVE